MKRRRCKKREKRGEPLAVIAIALLAGTALMALAGFWIISGKIEYWMGPTERHHFITPIDSTSFWIFVGVLVGESAVLWVHSVRALCQRLRVRRGRG
jgi:hypothetical protein